MEDVKQLCAILKPFHEFTLQMSQTKFATISIILPALTRLKEILHCLVLPANLDIIAKELHSCLETRSAAYYSNILVLAATYLDPRHRRFRFIK